MNYLIPAQNIEALDKAMTRIGNKCAKLGISFSYEKLGTCLMDVILPKVGTIKVEAVEVSVEGTAIINGWKFLAEIEHHFDGNIVSSYVKADEAWFTCKPKCEHCNTVKNRKVTYIIENESGERKQVGKSCLALYTHGLSADMAAAFASVLKLAKEYSEDFSGLSEKHMAYGIEAFVSRTIKIIQEKGYDRFNFFSQFENAKNSVGASDAIVDEFLEWANNYDPKSDFERNAVNAVKIGYVTLMKTGRTIAAFISKWLKTRPIESDSEHVGNVGERISIRVSNPSTQVSILYYKHFSTGYRTIETPVFKIVDDDSNVYIYSGDCLSCYGSFYSVVIKATVKEHNVYKGEKQTVINRPKEEDM